MKRAYFIFALLLLAYQQPILANEVVGQGWGDTEAAAKREALADISSRISVTVRSNFKTTQTVSSKTVEKNKTETVNQASESTIETNSELPILGADFIVHNEGRQVLVKAILETSRNLPQYETKLDELRARINSLNSRVAKERKSEAQYSGLMDILTLLDEFKKLNTVAVYLGGTAQFPDITDDVLQNQLRAVTRQVDSLDLAAKLLSDGVDESEVYIYPAQSRNSNEITPFAALLKDKISAHMKTVLSPRDATYSFIGQYLESGEGIDVTYHLLDSAAVAQKTNTVHIVKKAYTGLETVPKAADFEQLLKAGVAVSGDLHVDVSTNIGSHDLLFKKGDEVEFLVKLSESGYFYVLGHTAKQTESNSYLVELHQADGPRKFVYFINADDANKWISIGKFRVIAPFGVEGIQVFASTQDLVDALPSASLDSATGLYFVAANPHDGIIKTRAIIKNFSRTVQTSESSLMFTTMEK